MLPLANTIILLTSGVTLVLAHRAMIEGIKSIILNGLYISITLGILFS
jgi:heme/copper-type cytochrome/quinol oxidase subunit 3